VRLRGRGGAFAVQGADEPDNARRVEQRLIDAHGGRALRGRVPRRQDVRPFERVRNERLRRFVVGQVEAVEQIIAVAAQGHCRLGEAALFPERVAKALRVPAGRVQHFGGRRHAAGPLRVDVNRQARPTRNVAVGSGRF
jgi:hypothetical protein